MTEKHPSWRARARKICPALLKLVDRGTDVTFDEFVEAVIADGLDLDDALEWSMSIGRHDAAR